MSDLMLLGVLQMPIDMVMADKLSTVQYIQRGHEAADRIKADADALSAANALVALLRASLRKSEDEADALRKDAERYRFARDNIMEGYELPGSFHLSDHPGADWDRTIDAAMTAPQPDGAQET